MVFVKSLQSILPQVESLAESKVVLGKPVAVGTIKLVPVISIKVGLGSGRIDGLKTGGGGGGISVDPCAVLVINEKNEVSVYPVHGQNIDVAEPAGAITGLERLGEQVREASEGISREG